MVKIVNLGYFVARLTENDKFPKNKLEIFAPGINGVSGEILPGECITLCEDSLIKLIEFLISNFPNIK